MLHVCLKWACSTKIPTTGSHCRPSCKNHVMPVLAPEVAQVRVVPLSDVIVLLPLPPLSVTFYRSRIQRVQYSR